MSKIQVLNYLLSIDARSLAALRVCLGSLLLYESLHYSQPTPAAGTFYEFLVLHNEIVILPFAAAFTAGFFTRSTNALCWLVYLLKVRHGLFAGCADLGNYVLLLLLFWGMLLPLGSRWSVDRIRCSDHQRPPGRFLSVGTAALLLQVFVIYYSAGISKNWNEWVVAGNALDTILSGEAFPTSMGRYLLNYPDLLVGLSRFTVVLEIFGPLLLFVPGPQNGSIRAVLVGCFMAFHLGLSLCMHLGIFPFVCMAAWLLYLPSSVWDVICRGRRMPVDRFGSVDKSWIRNGLAALFFVYIGISNALNWVGPESATGLKIQKVGKHLCLYQQWFMFNTPSRGKRK